MVTYKRNDTAPPLQDTLTDRDGNPVNLTGNQGVLLLLHRIGDPEATFLELTAAIVGPEVDGVVEYDWQTGDLDTVGFYEVEWQVTYADSSIESFPGETHQLVRVIADLNPAA